MNKTVLLIINVIAGIGAIAFIYFGISGEGYQFMGGVGGRIINIVCGICILANIYFKRNS